MPFGVEMNPVLAPAAIELPALICISRIPGSAPKGKILKIQGNCAVANRINLGTFVA